jgi:hypothetical protein
MQTVSEKWKENHTKTLLPESFVEITFSLTDPDAFEDSSASDNGSVNFSNTAQIVNEVDKNIVSYATLEQNLWLLDGSKKVLPTSNYGDCGYISNVLCDAQGAFTNAPIVTLSFSKVHQKLIPGITIDWGTAYGEYATDFTVTVYNGSTVVGTKRVTDNASTKTLVMLDIINYNRITLTINKWCLPYRRARIEEIFIGAEKIYTKHDLFSFSHTQEVDPISSSLPKSTISFSLDNTKNIYNPNNDEGLSKYLVERQELKARYGYKVGDDVEWIDCGTFYMSEWEAKQNGKSADFTARDILEYMTDVYNRGVYAPDGKSLYELAQAVLEFANLPLQDDGSVRWVIDESLKSIYTTAPLPVDTCANCLQIIANAGECVMYQDRKGVLHIERRTNTLSDYTIDQNNSYSKPETSLAKPCKQIVVPIYSYSEDEENDVWLYRGFVEVNGTADVLINYSETASWASALIDTTKSEVSGTINSKEFYANCCKLNITANGKIYLKIGGEALISSSKDKIIPVGATGDEIVVDNPLITDEARALAVGQWVKNYMSNRQSISFSWRSDPRLDGLDVIKSKDAFTENNVIMTKVSYTYNGAFRGTGEGKVI